MFSWFRSNAPAVNPKQRMFGSAENALMRASQEYRGHTKVGEVLHLRGPHISIEALTAAVRQLQHRHPVLRSRLRSDPVNANCYLLEEDPTFQLEILPMSRKRDEHLTFWRREWREREHETTQLGQGLVKLWLLQDPNDDNDDNAPRELVFVCEHSICDGLSLSTTAHELLCILGSVNTSFMSEPLNWAPTMEEAIGNSLSTFGKFLTLGRFIFTAIYQRSTKSLATARIPLATVDFPLTEMSNHCHTEHVYGILNVEETQKLREKCRQENITVTSAVSSAILSAVSTLIHANNNDATALTFSVGADARRRCVPPVTNHDLAYQVSGIIPFSTPAKDMPTTPTDMWQLAKTFGHHMQTSVDAGQVLACGLIMGKIFGRTISTPDSPELPTCGISSWGVLPFQEQYGKWKLTEMTPFVNMVQVPVPFTMLQSVNGVLTFTVAGAEPVVPRATVTSLCDGTMQILKQMIEV